MRAKLYGFMDRAGRRRATAIRRATHSLPARYARAIAAYRFSDPRGAIAQIDALIQAQPQNPYFHELKGQALLEGGKPAEAIAPLRRAVELAPNPALIQIMLGQALVASNDRGASRRGGVDPRSRAAPRTGIARGLYPAGHGLWPQGRPRPRRPRLRAGGLRARRHEGRARLAARAKTRFPVGSPGWVKADDIASYKPPNERAQQI